MLDSVRETLCIILLILLIGIISLSVLFHYLEDASGILFSAILFISFFFGFVGIAIFPFDIGVATEGSAASKGLVGLWNVIYWITFLLSWVILPLMMDYWASGEFSKKSRFRESVVNYIRHYAILGGILICVLLYILIAKNVSFASLQGIIIALMNTYGLCYVVFYLGFGLVALPFYLYKSIHPKQEINELYKQGQELDTDKFDYEMQVVSVKCNVRELQRMMEHTGKSKELMTIIQSMIDCMPGDEELDLKRHMRGHVDKSEWIVLDEESVKKMNDKALMGVLSKLNNKLKRTCLVYQRKMNQYDELLETIAELRHATGTSEIPLETNYSSKDRYYYFFRRLWMAIRSPFFTCCFFLSLILSCLTLLTEFTTILYQLTNKSLSPFGWSFHFAFSTSFRVFIAFCFLFYVSACFFFSFFNLRVPFINFYSLYPHHTDVYALSGNATYLTRFQFSLFYHFFTLLQLPQSAYASVALSKVLGEMNTIPFLGTQFNSYMPVLVILTSVVVVVRGAKVMQAKRKGDIEMLGPDSEKMKIREGKEIVEMSLRKRGIETGSREQHSTKRR
ncbi:hypothetical protein WA556_003429, partial [Blastocystis sp. ATCC 50177/Nand II]